MLALCAGLVAASCSGVPADRDLSGVETLDIGVGGQTLTVAIADDATERRQGLSGVDDLGGLDGMLFVFDEPTETTFSMTDTLLPLDIWFIDATGKIVGTAEMELCDVGPCTQFASPGPVGWVLETPAGVFDFDSADQLSNLPSQ